MIPKANVVSVLDSFDRLPDQTNSVDAAYGSLDLPAKDGQNKSNELC
jgi:hypothetical protein